MKMIRCERCKGAIPEERIAGRITLCFCRECYVAVYGSVEEARLALMGGLMRAERDAKQSR